MQQRAGDVFVEQGLDAFFLGVAQVGESEFGPLGLTGLRAGPRDGSIVRNAGHDAALAGKKVVAHDGWTAPV